MRPALQLRRWAGPAGLAVAAAATLSPLEALGARSFAAHMAGHLILIIGAAPLLAAWQPGPSVRSTAARLLRAVPGGAWLAHWIGGAEAAWASAAIFAITILGWHLPAAHDLALADPAMHWLEHLTMLGAATLFWRLVVLAGDGGAGRGASLLMIWLISLQGALLSAIIMFAPSQLCSAYAGNPIADQVAAGLLMCIPASLVYAATTVLALMRLMGEGKRHVG